ncbi:MAG: transposase [Ignavibacteriales bacterium]|nr:transposase [Ignavibacteriales bacterium]
MLQKISRKPFRYGQDDSCYFLTFCTYRRRPLLHLPGIPEMIIENLKFYSSRIKSLIAYTVMPDHVHLMIDVGIVKEMSDFLRDFKKRASKEVCKLVPFVRSPIWLRGSMDHCIRDDEDFRRHLEYIFYNCWKHLGIPPKDFPYHNFLEFVDRGWLDIDFLGLDYGSDFDKHE